MGLAAALFLTLAAISVNQVGVVGEVAIGWGLGAPPDALVQISPPLWADGARDPTAGHRWGPWVLSQVRPIDRLSLGGVDLPLAINRYTGGPPDWPARLLHAATGSVVAVVALHVLFGLGLLGLTVRFVGEHAGPSAAVASGLVLASDWSFVFYRKVLGGTEIALMLGALLLLWGLWSRRWTGGRWGLTLVGVGVGVGLLGKVTFALTVGAVGLTALAMRWDKGTMRPPLPRRPWEPLAWVVLWTAPLWLAAAHGALAPELPAQVRSHDFGGQQWRRVVLALTGGPSPAREGLGNLHTWALHPLGFFEVAYGAAAVAPTKWRILGWGVVVAGLLRSWRGRHPTPRQALARFMSVLLPAQTLLLLVVARDLHHLAQAAPTFAIAAGLAADQLAALRAPPRSARRAIWAVAFCAPLVVAGASDLLRTDTVVDSISVPTFTARGQLALVDLLEAHAVERLVVADYESYGMLELRAPSVAVEHVWPAVAMQGRAALPDVLRRASGAHLLVVQASAPMIYNLRATTAQLIEAGAAVGLRVEPVGALGDGRATLYAVRPAD